MKALYKAVMVVLENGVKLAGGIHWGRAKETSPLPYIVVTGLPSLSLVVSTSEQGIENRGVRFSVFAKTAQTCYEILASIEKLFVGRVLVLTSGKCMDCVKGSDDCSIDPDKTEEGEDVWHGVLDIDFTVQRGPGE